MRTLTFEAIMVVEDENPNIMKVLAGMQNSEYNISTTDEFISKPVIFLEKKLSTENPQIEQDEANTEL